MEIKPLLAVYAGSVLLGLSVAAPIGPINVEIIRRGLTRSSRSAFALGCGAVSADCCYFTLALLGARIVTRMGESGIARTLGLLLGGAMLGYLGVSAIRSARSIQGVPPGISASAVQRQWSDESGMLRTYGLGLMLTLANPMTIALWLSIAAGFAAAGTSSGSGSEMILRLSGVFTGALSWVCCVTAVTARARRWINPEAMRAVNALSGAILLIYAGKFLLRIFVAG